MINAQGENIDFNEIVDGKSPYASQSRLNDEKFDSE